MAGYKLHLVSFNVPFPTDYGGVIDVFYKIKALKSVGFEVHLHCFEYGRLRAAELEASCRKVSYYERFVGWKAHFSWLPYIVQSRKNGELLKNLLEDDAPILFEGLHTCVFLGHQALSKRLKIVRMHNVEWQYYEHLASIEPHFWKRLFFEFESKKLKIFENILKKSDAILAISPMDEAYLRKKYPTIPTYLVTAFHPNEALASPLGRGEFCLFHGDLSVQDNEQAAFFLISEVFNDLEIPFVIAGRQPSKALIDRALAHNVSIFGNINQAEMNDLLRQAQATVLVSFQSAGMKLKLVDSLYKSRFCVVNSKMVEQTGLEELCWVGDTAAILKEKIRNVFYLNFEEKEKERREKILKKVVENQTNAQKISQVIKDLTGVWLK